MNLPTPHGQSEQRIAAVEARLRHATPIWRAQDVALFRTDSGFYVVWDKAPNAPTIFIGITPDGEVSDLSGRGVDAGDIEYATNVFGRAGQQLMKQQVITWPRRRR
jgi:hypothetical protein